jgi:hypothetical protein
MKINPLHPIGVIVLVVVLLYMRHKKSGGSSFPASDFGKTSRAAATAPARPARPPQPEEPPEVVYAKHRRQALETSAQSLGQAGEVGEHDAFGFLMEMGMGSVVTLACFADGDAGLYYQAGGGMKGGISHESVRKVVKVFMAQSQAALPHMTPAAEQPMPAAGRVVFYALTPSGILGAAMDREELEEPDNPFGPLFRGGQEVVAEMRKVQRAR